ncbi:hypothetical protein QJ48_15525 [Paenibacillus sp. A3]|uniref:hypothetical protein n=1 Tax=Paenibacillus sp. A3 TaxID=1337054 RepID=UPI0006D55AA1|nr:hypothetical protein [Paenibacillus sp. A3]KPV58559.1 hypothetical protein QJ48_15525 [Paenibacillus sp. A3]
MSKPKLAVFFGAGAEIGYGLPSGGRFALDIFRLSPEEDRNRFRKQIERIDPTSPYAAKWLPGGYRNKRLHVFGKGEFEGLITSSLENRKDSILHYFDRFDANVACILRTFRVSEPVLKQTYAATTGHEFGTVSYRQVIKLNQRLADRVSLFDSDYFSAFLKALEHAPQDRGLRRMIRALLELLIGAFGQNLVSRLNEELFEQAPDTLSVFDDLSGIFSLDYRSAGLTGVEIVLEEQPLPLTESSSLATLFTELGRAVLEDVFASALDYQALIDSHFRYLYNPKAHWAKFTRIAIFLHTVRRYILSQAQVDLDKLFDGPGFYHDLLEADDCFELRSVGTVNYNNFVGQVLERSFLKRTPVFHLNGSVGEFYDPYGNRILQDHDGGEPPEQLRRILVPFLFTQSGIKPLTSVSMSRRYVELYDTFREADVICSIGYGFNGDDGHINGLLRALVEEEDKRLVIFAYGCTDPLWARREYQAKLRLASARNLTVAPLDDERRSGGLAWYRQLAESLSGLRIV